MNNKYCYFQFNGGRFFRVDDKKENFQILKNSVWEDCPELLMYYDVSSDYYAITDKAIIDILESYDANSEKQK